MFSLYIKIDHYKLLKKSKTISEELLGNMLLDCITNWGGLVSDYSFALSHFPSNYGFSRVNFLKFIKDIYELLNSLDELVGFSLIVDDVYPSNENC